MNQDKILYKIISGRTSFKLGDLFLCFYEPTADIISKSYAVYEEAYDEAYKNNCYTEEQYQELLLELDIWSPHYEKEAERLKTSIDDKKVYIYENFNNFKESKIARKELYIIDKKYKDFIARKHKHSFLTCHSVAENARWNWMFSVSTFNDGQPVGESVNSDSINKIYASKMVDNEQIRECAKLDTWRSIWNCNKIHGGLLFNRSPTDYSRDQINLCSFSIMYDNIYEHPESPNEKIIDDNDAIDGWLIKQRRKSESDKKKNEKVVKNSKIANSQEQFIMAANEEEARIIYDMNDEQSKRIIKQRFNLIDQMGTVKDKDFTDRKQEIEIAQMDSFRNKLKGR